MSSGKLTKQRSGTLNASQSTSVRGRGKKPVVTVTKTGNSKIFKAYQEREYCGPDIKINKDELPAANQAASNGLANYPVFLGVDGTLYDVNYVPVQNAGAATTELSQEEENDKTSLRFQSESELLKAMPQPSQFDNFLAYEKALLDWKTAVEQVVGALRLPNPVGRSYYRPRVISTDRSRSYSSNAYSMEPVNSDPENADKQDDKLDEEDLYKKMNSPEYSNNRGQFMKLIEKKKGANDLDPKKFAWTSDSWDASLVPQEPDPSYYDSYEDYEAAMKRWALIVSEQLPVIPPHASQLKDLIPIQTIDVGAEETPAVEQPKQEKENAVKIKTGVTVVPFFPTMDFPPLVPIKVRSDLPIEKGNEFADLPQKAKDILNTQLKDKLLRVSYTGMNSDTKAMRDFVPPMKEDHALNPHFNLETKAGQFDKMANILMFNHQILPVIHGTFTKPWEQRTGSSSSLLRKSTKAKYLRRADLTTPMISACMDCSAEIDGKRVEFKVPELELEQADLAKIATDPKYNEIIKQSFKQLTFADRNDDLNSWYHPGYSKEILKKQREQADQILAGSKFDKMTIDMLNQLVSLDMFLDKFQDIMAENMKEEDDGIARTYLQAFLNAINADNFHEVLQLFERHHSRLIHAKLAVFVSEILQSARAKAILEKLILTLDLKSLSLVAYAMSFTSEIPSDIFPFNPETHALILNIIGKEYNDLLQTLFAYYYISLISGVISKQPFIFVAINQFMIESRKSTAASVSALLQESSDFLCKHVWKCLSHRSSSVSSVFLFLFLQLLTIPDSASITKQLQSDSTNMLDNIRFMSRSKISHVQFATQRLLYVLSKEPWLEFVYQKYSVSGDSIYDDLCMPFHKNGKMNLMTSFALGVSLEALDRVTESNLSKLSFLLDETFWSKVLKTIDASKRSLDNTGEILSRLLHALTKAYSRLNLITANMNIKLSSNKKKGNLSLTVTPPDIQKIIQLIQDAQRTDGDAEKAYIIKRELLAALRHLVRVPIVFDIIRKELDFYSKLLYWCRECTNPDFNREAWFLFYKIIQYHGGVMDFLKSGTLLAQLLEGIGTASHPTVMQNGLRWLNKIFSLPIEEVKNQQSGKAFSRVDKDPLKSLEKDIKKLGEFYVSHTLFIKVHMIYKKLVPKCSGPAFLELARFYYALCNYSYNNKVLKDTIKKPDYKAGLEHLNGMFNVPTEESTDKKVKPELKKSPSKFFLKSS